MRLSMVAAGFSGSEADQLRRAISSWGKNSKLLLFEKKFINGLLNNGYSLDFAERLFEQVKGFGGYGFPESHSASFALLCYASSWLKCHHPAAFYCALLNSQPMGFYSPSQLIQDARRHQIQIMPVDINCSRYENSLELDANQHWGIRLGFQQVKSLDAATAQHLEVCRGQQAFKSLEDLARRTGLTAADLQILASADVLKTLSGNRYQSRWQAAAIQPYSELLDQHNHSEKEDLLTKAPSLQKDILDDYRTLGLSLREHPMALLRKQPPFNKCSREADLVNLRHKGFVRVAGIVTGKQRPGSASGVMFISLEDETGTINVVVWTKTQEQFRSEILTGKLLLVTGTVEIVTENVSTPIVHVIAGNIKNLSSRLQNFPLKSRDFH